MNKHLLEILSYIAAVLMLIIGAVIFSVFFNGGLPKNDVDIIKENTAEGITVKKLFISDRGFGNPRLAMYTFSMDSADCYNALHNFVLAEEDKLYETRYEDLYRLMTTELKNAPKNQGDIIQKVQSVHDADGTLYFYLQEDGRTDFYIYNTKMNLAICFIRVK